MGTLLDFIYLAEFFLEREIFQKKFVEKIETRILCLKTFLRKPCLLLDNVEKYCRARQTGHRCQYGARTFQAR
jgi:hypothetical protein